MKNSFAFVLIIFIASAGLLSGCKKKDDPKPVSKTELLAGTSSKKWKLTALTASALGQTFDLFDKNNLSQIFVEDCQKDNLYIFYADKKYEEDEGTNKCDPADPQKADSGTWSMSSDETKLSINSSNGGAAGITAGDITIKELSNTTLKGELTQTSQGIPVTLNATFTAAQ